eukprot:TRINITY_DN10379_c0_g1_i1.p1 TRINITY_DN10379_c0_g1~~TRINITY_DN10379_c0_g1_i1.p1  ORF type:complete len:433 (-),score=68.22 TRINITY_DN10379_c0_g1_i1:168-1466(-)
MACCVRCGSKKGGRIAGAVYEPEDDAPVFNMSVLEAADRSVTICFDPTACQTRSGHGGSSSSSSSVVASLLRRRRRRGPTAEEGTAPLLSDGGSSNGRTEFLLQVLGGPDCNLHGPRSEQIEVGGSSSSSGDSRVTHKVDRLQPGTEYTLFLLVRLPGRESSLTESLDVRTADATTALFAGEDFGRSGKKSENKKGNFAADDFEEDLKADPKKTSGGSPSTSSHQRPGRTPSGPTDDVSTIAPSEMLGDVNDPVFDDTTSDADLVSERGDAFNADDVAPLLGTPRGPVVALGEDDGEDVPEAPAANGMSTTVGEIHSLDPEEGEDDTVASVCESNAEVGEWSPRRGRGGVNVQCNLWNSMDCLRGRGGQGQAQEDAEEVVVQPQQVTQYRTWRPVRAPFPGVAVDPASVGLAHLNAQQFPAPPPSDRMKPNH